MKCKKHPKYIKPKRPPTSDCGVCRKIWRIRYRGITIKRKKLTNLFVI